MHGPMKKPGCEGLSWFCRYLCFFLLSGSTKFQEVNSDFKPFLKQRKGNLTNNQRKYLELSQRFLLRTLHAWFPRKTPDVKDSKRWHEWLCMQIWKPFWNDEPNKFGKTIKINMLNLRKESFYADFVDGHDLPCMQFWTHFEMNERKFWTHSCPACSVRIALLWDRMTSTCDLYTAFSLSLLFFSARPLICRYS